ncbi:MAG: galactose mutarotase [Acidobacteria bacterium]|nr:galactose mutarotase [Acidobacteriota bacterium]
MNTRAIIIAFVASVAAAAAGNSTPARFQPAQRATLSRAPFGRMADGTAVEIFTLTSGAGMDVRTMPYGAGIVSIRVPDRNGAVADVVLGFDTLDEYVTKNRFFGVVAGRYGNRIAQGRFTLDGTTYTLATNNGVNHLHGGVKGFDKVVWSATPFERAGTVGVVYSHTSPDGDEGYPGELRVRVTYSLSSSNALTVDYDATTTKPTPINLTQHTYFNLAGDGSGDILGHQVTIDADRFTPVGATLIPTGELAPVADTPFDFRRPIAVGARIGADDPQLKAGNGYDHNFVLNKTSGGSRGPAPRTVGPRGSTGSAPLPQHAARVVHPGSGRTLDVSTSEPGVQFYTANSLNAVAGKSGHVYQQYAGLCLETQHFPDSPNHPDFPSSILRPGERFQSRTVFAFGVTR